MGFRKISLEKGKKIILGKSAEGNDELMRMYMGKPNTILHTKASGSPFGVIEKLKPTRKEIYLAGAAVARYSQDWRDNKKDVVVEAFTGKDISKESSMKPGTWMVKKSRNITVKKRDILMVDNSIRDG
jgi:predicted ribosome quality control (RQC) complex YloA/Tae2 family protein